MRSSQVVPSNDDCWKLYQPNESMYVLLKMGIVQAVMLVFRDVSGLFFTSLLTHVGPTLPSFIIKKNEDLGWDSRT